MASKITTSALAFLFILNLLFFTLATAKTSCSPSPKPKPKPTPSPSTPSGSTGKCPIDTLKLGVCANVLGLINLNIGTPPKTPCCSLLGNLADLEAAVCLCTTIRAGILGINLNVPVNLSLLLNYCGKSVPTGFQCV